MYCMKCNHNLADCLCPDLQERLQRIAQDSNFVYRKCTKCNLHYSKCKCKQPEWIIEGSTINKGE